MYANYAIMRCLIRTRPTATAMMIKLVYIFCKLEIVVAHVFGWHTLVYKIHI